MDAREFPRAPSDPHTIASLETYGVRLKSCEKVNEYVLVREGRREMEMLQIKAVKDELWKNFGQHAQMIGAGNCYCRSGQPALATEVCLVLHVPEGAIAPLVAATALQAALEHAGAGDATGRLKMSLAYALGPRCAVDDPACGPVPYDDRARCAEQVGYVPSKVRKSIAQHGGGTCTRDGECIVGGCGNDCVSTNEVMLPGTCEYLSGLSKRGLCGCVDGSCRWFVQE